MTPEGPLERPEFTAVDLAVDAEAADRYIEEAVAGLYRSDADDTAKYRTTGGTLVAVVGSPHSGSGEATATLAYRTAPATELATRKASKIRAALDRHAIDG